MKFKIDYFRLAVLKIAYLLLVCKRSSKLVDFKELSNDGEQWELFARDFLAEQGFYIEVPPDRGPDGGKDIVITEQLKGALGKYEFKWIVSCKHFANSGRSVTEKDEINIRERLESFQADGFIGFYSTVASSGLNSRLTQLRQQGKIKDYKIFDHRLIENYLLRVGYSKILMRYLPESYKIIKPLHLLTEEYIPLKCELCGKDLLHDLQNEEHQSVIVEVLTWTGDITETTKYFVEDIYWACKGSCDRLQEQKYSKNSNVLTRWNDLSDLVIPTLFLRWLNTFFEKARRGEHIYSDKAANKKHYATLAIAQKTLREMTEKEFNRANALIAIG